MSEPGNGSPSTPGASHPAPPPSLWRDVRGAASLLFRSPLVLSLLAPLLFVTMLLALFGTGLQGLAFLHPRQTTHWHMLVALMPTTWVTVLVLVLGDLQRNRSAWPRARGEWVAVVLYASIGVSVTALPLLAQYHAWKEVPHVHAAMLRVIPHVFMTTLLTDILGVVIAALLITAEVNVITQLLARFPVYERRGVHRAPEDLDEDVRWYQECRSRVRWLLNLSALIIGTSLLGVGAFRNLLNLSSLAPTEVLPIAPVMGYGIYYTGLLGGFYLSVDRILKDVGQTLMERLVHQSLGEHASWKQHAEEQQAARAYLGLQSSALQELQQGLTVFTPLLASISSLILSPSG